MGAEKNPYRGSNMGLTYQLFGHSSVLRVSHAKTFIRVFRYRAETKEQTSIAKKKPPTLQSDLLLQGNSQRNR